MRRAWSKAAAVFLWLPAWLAVQENPQFVRIDIKAVKLSIQPPYMMLQPVAGPNGTVIAKFE
jgi:hypothetical protein